MNQSGRGGVRPGSEPGLADSAVNQSGRGSVRPSSGGRVLKSEVRVRLETGDSSPAWTGSGSSEEEQEVHLTPGEMEEKKKKAKALRKWRIA